MKGYRKFIGLIVALAAEAGLIIWGVNISEQMQSELVNLIIMIGEIVIPGGFGIYVAGNLKAKKYSPMALQAAIGAKKGVEALPATDSINLTVNPPDVWFKDEFFDSEVARIAKKTYHEEGEENWVVRFFAAIDFGIIYRNYLQNKVDKQNYYLRAAEVGLKGFSQSFGWEYYETPEHIPNPQGGRDPMCYWLSLRSMARRTNRLYLLNALEQTLKYAGMPILKDSGR